MAVPLSVIYPPYRNITDTDALRIIASFGASAGGSGGTATLFVQQVGFTLAPPGTTNQALSYYGSTNNVERIVYTGGTTTRTIMFTYVNGAVADSDKVSNISQADS